VAWVDATYLNNAIGSAQVTALGLTGDRLTQFELSARATVSSVLQYAGYALPSDTLESGTVTTAFLQRLTAAILLRDAFALVAGIQLPPDIRELISEGQGMLDGIYAKRLPIPGMQPDPANGYGGNRFSPTSSGTTGARPQVFNLRGTNF
jgi:hypothetical protein